MGIAVAAVNPFTPTTSQITNGDPGGEIVFPLASNPGGFFGGGPNGPVVQPVGSGSLTGQVGTVTIYGTNQTPSAVTANTAAEQSFTVTGVATGQLVIVVKPTAQAGLIVGTARVSATNTVQITFGNDTSGSITPTAAELYETVAIPANMLLSAALTPVAVAANTTAEQQFTVAGLTVGNAAWVNKPTAQAGLVIVGSRVVSTNVLGITYANVTASPITPTAETYLVYAAAALSFAPVMATFSVVLNPANVAANTTAEQTFTVPGLISGAPVFVNKPSLTPGIGIGGARASAANTLAINFVNDTANIIDPPQEAYVIAGFFSAPANSASVATLSQVGGSVVATAAMVALGLVAAT